MDTVNTTFDEVWNAEWGDENVTTAELASRLAASMTDGWGFIIDFWPQVCLALSIASSIYIVYSTRLSVRTASGSPGWGLLVSFSHPAESQPELLRVIL